MECNKEEALRAMVIAESRMQTKDFVGARKIALKAQQLFPSLENISHLLTVCDVHCAAEIKVNGETDWYGILQADTSADESLIKKQYRKLALLLHPDKNKFIGAEAAFKIIGEAHIILSDKGKRSLHDIKRSAKFNVTSRLPSRQLNRSTIPKKQPDSVNTTSNGFNVKLQQQQESSSSNTRETFWTICPNCAMRYQYYTSVLHKSLRCQNCLLPFTAYNLSSQASPPGAKAGSLGTAAYEKAPQSASNVIPQDESKRPSKQGENSGEVKFEKVELNRGNKREHTSSGNFSRHRMKLVLESSETDNSDSDDRSDSEDGMFLPPRRSARQKRNFSYNENENEQELGSSFPTPKKAKKESRSNGTNPSNERFVVGEDGDSEVEVINGGPAPLSGVNDKKKEPNLPSGYPDKKRNSGHFTDANTDLNSVPTIKVTNYTYPDSEFFDFDMLRQETKFAVDQIWSVYDDLDGMPRYYVRIRSLISPGFKLRFSWLEYLPVNEAEMVWSDEELPVSCGNFQIGKSAFATDRLMFSEPINWNKGFRRNSYTIYPRKGEVWALFKDWDIQWSADSVKDRVYQYEIVEVLSDLEEGEYFSVCRLLKINGFVCLFTRAVSNGVSSLIKIPNSEVLRFSHKVPSYRTVGNEREGIPAGLLELDPASLPWNVKNSFPSISLDLSMEKINERLVGSKNARTTMNDQNGDSSESENNVSIEGSKPSKIFTSSWDNPSKDSCLHGANANNAKQKKPSASEPPNTSGTYDLLESEFYHFAEDKLIVKFQKDQIWALYCEIDTFPKYYAFIRDVDRSKGEISISWLESVPLGKEDKLWLRKELPVSCGLFEIAKDKFVFETSAFSHQVQKMPIGKKNRYAVFPSVGEVWAIYRGWDGSWTQHDIENCEYDVAEILERSISIMRVQPLTKVTDHRSVFMAEGSTKEFGTRYYIQFSHRIPAFRLTEEQGGKLRGYWDLDTASIPEARRVRGR